jgi:hypothetical protein
MDFRRSTHTLRDAATPNAGEAFARWLFPANLVFLAYRWLGGHDAFAMNRNYTIGEFLQTIKKQNYVTFLQLKRTES